MYEWRLDILGSTSGTPAQSSLDDGSSSPTDDEVDEEEDDGGDIFYIILLILFFICLANIFSFYQKFLFYKY